MSLLDDQIEATERALLYLQRLGRKRARAGKPVTRLIDLAMGLELVLKNLRFQKEHEVHFRDLARQRVLAKQYAEDDDAARNVLDVFPDAEITVVDIEDLEKLA